MSKIKHLAIRTSNPEKLAQFYQDVFDMKILRRSPIGAVYVTDGYFNLALLPPKVGKPNGFLHFGFQVDDMDAIAAKLEQAGMAGPEIRDNNPPFAETRAADPEGNLFDLSVHGFEKPEFVAEQMLKAKAGKKAKEPV